MRVAAITKLFPNAAQPLAAPFNRQQFAALASLCDLEVLATIPWHPLRRWGNAPRRETLEGLSVAHPRTLYVPRALHGQWARLYAASLLPWLASLRRADVLLAAWAYPDGVGVLRLAAHLHKPVVVKVHGSDINHIATMAGPRRELQAWLKCAAAVVCVNSVMVEAVAELGVPRAKICVVENGLDTATYFVRPSAEGAAVRQAAGLATATPVILYVGNLKAEKGVLDLGEAVRAPALAGATLVILGDGPARGDVEALVAASRAANWPGARVLWLGPQPAPIVSAWMNAAQVLCLPSWMEGTPNVVREALACGLPVVASEVGGIPALVGPHQGQLVPPRAPARLAEALASGLAKQVATPGDALALQQRRELAQSSHAVSWRQSAAALHEVLVRAVTRPGAMP